MMLSTVTADLESAQRLSLGSDSPALSDLPRDVYAELQHREAPLTPDRPAGAAGGVESSLPEPQGCFEGASASSPALKCEVSQDETGEMHAEVNCKELGSVATGEGDGEGGVRTDRRAEPPLSPMQGDGVDPANEITVAECSAAEKARPIDLEADITDMDVDAGRAEGLEASAAGTCGRELTESESSCSPVKKSEVPEAKNKTGLVTADSNDAVSAAAWALEVVSMETEQMETKTQNSPCIGDGNEEPNTHNNSADNHPCGGSAHEAGEPLPCGNLLENKLSQAELKDVSVAKVESSGQTVEAAQSTGVGRDLMDNHWVHSRFDELAPYIRPHDEDEILGVCAENEVVLGVDRCRSEQKDAEDSVRGEGEERLPAELSSESQSEVISEAEPAAGLPGEGCDVPVLTRSEVDQAERAVPCECVTRIQEGGSAKGSTPCSAGLGSPARVHCGSDRSYCSQCNRNIEVPADCKIASSDPAKHLNKSDCCPLGDNVPARAPSETTRDQSVTPQACDALETESQGAAQPPGSDFSVRLSGEEDPVELLHDETDLSRQAAHGEQALTEKQCEVRLENNEATSVAMQKSEDALHPEDKPEQRASSEAAAGIGTMVSADRTGSTGALGERDPDRGTESGGDGVKLGVSECRADRGSQLNSEDEKDTLGTPESSIGNPSALENRSATDITPHGAGAAAVADGAAVNGLFGTLEQETLSSLIDVERPLTESESGQVSGSVEIPPQPREGCKTAAVSDGTTESVCRTVELESRGRSTLNDKDKSVKETEGIETSWQPSEDCRLPCEGELDCSETSQSQGSCKAIPNCHAEESEIHEDPVDPATPLQTGCDVSGDGERSSAESSEPRENRLDPPGHFRTGCDDEATPEKRQPCEGAEEDAERPRASDEELDCTEGHSDSQGKNLTSIDKVEASAEGGAALKNSLVIKQQPADPETVRSELAGRSEEIAEVPLERMEHQPAVCNKSTFPMHAASSVACSQSNQALLVELVEETILSEGERTTECTLQDPSAPHTSECCNQKHTSPTEIDNSSKTSSCDPPCTSHTHSVPVEPGKAPNGKRAAVEGEFGKPPRKKRVVELRKQPGRSCKAGTKVPEPLQDLRRMRDSNAQVFIRTQVANIAELGHGTSETMNHAVHSGAVLNANLPKEERAFPSLRNETSKPHKPCLNVLRSVKCQKNIQEPLLLKLSNVASSLVPVRSPQKFRPFYRSSKALPYRLERGLKAGAADVSVCMKTKFKPSWYNSFCCRLPHLKGHSLKNVTFQSLALSCNADLSKVSLYRTDRWKPLVTFTTPAFPVSFHVRLGSMSSLPSGDDDDDDDDKKSCSSNLMLHEASIQPPSSSSSSSLSSEWTCSSFSPDVSAGYRSVVQNTTLTGFSGELHPVVFTCSGSSEPRCRSCSFSECQELVCRTASSSSSPFSRFGLHTVLALSSPACYRVWTRRRCLGSRVPAVQKRFLSQFEEGLKVSSSTLKENLFPSLHYSLGRIVAAWSSRGPAACLPDFTTFSCLDTDHSYARQLLECFVASSFAEDRAAAGVANESDLNQPDCTLQREPCLMPLSPVSDRPVFALLDQTAAQIRPKSLMAWSSLPAASCMECRASDSAQRSAALPEILGVSYPEMKEQSVLEKSLVSEPGQRTKRVSQIRIRKTVPKPDNNLTPMGLPKPKRLKKKEFSLEEIYTNKNYKSPPSNRSLETIFEEPKEKNGALVCIGQQKRKRVLEFQDFTVPRKRRARTGVKLKSSRTRGRKAAKQGCAELDVLLIEKLSALEHFFNTEHITI